MGVQKEANRGLISGAITDVQSSIQTVCPAPVQVEPVAGDEVEKIVESTKHTIAQDFLDLDADDDDDNDDDDDVDGQFQYCVEADAVAQSPVVRSDVPGPRRMAPPRCGHRCDLSGSCCICVARAPKPGI